MLRAQAARASGPAACAWSRSRARTPRPSAARATRSRRWWCAPRRPACARSARPTSSSSSATTTRTACRPARTSAPATSTSRASSRPTPRALHRVGAHLQAHHPVPERARPGVPGALRGALPAGRGRGGHRHPRQPPLRRRPGAQGAGARARRPPCRSRSSRRRGKRVAVIGSGPAGMSVGLLPRHRRPRGHRLRA